MELITRFNQAWGSFYTTWMGLDKPISYLNPVFHSLTTADEKRVERYQKFLSYYEGRHEQYLKTQPDKPNDNVVLNYSKRIVDKGVLYLFGKELELDITEYQQTALEDSLEQMFISDEWKQAFLVELGLTGAIYGDYYIQIDIKDGIPHPQLLNSLSVFPTFEASNYNNVIEYDIRWTEGETVWRIKHYPDGDVWQVEYQYQEKDFWIVDTERSYVWEYDFPMIIKGRNLPKPNSAFGYSDLEDADINDYINLATSNTNKILRMFAHPIIWGRGFNLKEADSTQILMTQDEKGVLGALELSKDLSSSQEYISTLKTAFAEITNVPESDPEKLKIGAQSGFALNVLNNDLMLKTQLKRSLYGLVLKEFCHKAFIILGVEDVDVKLNWQNPLPMDLREQTDGHRFDLESGLVSQKTLAGQRGYDYDEEVERRSQETEASTSLGELVLRNFERGING